MRRKIWIVSEFTLGEIFYPDDLGHAYADLRAWDRHLVSVGLLPIFTSDSSKVGPILVNPLGNREYLVYGYRNGDLTSWREVLKHDSSLPI